MSVGLPDLEFVGLISNLREELETIEYSLKARENYCAKREENHSRITNKFIELQDIQQNIIKLNIEGRLLTMAGNFIKKSKLRSILDDVFTGQTLFIDRNRKHIKI